uniref:Secreted protein n=1 Tax=Grammatophora oceanica TaxID=210454 RepID=A0A7S1Y4J6_9STRA|mmetsp:Transcript_19647/g.29076  ORF Transcript_19647/g.29076 Transcript_19647/m.29076 type:complete len:238 (+) Transcript_19647:369-1082(+)
MRFSKITILFVELLWWCSSDVALGSVDALFEKNKNDVEHQHDIIISSSTNAGDRRDDVEKKYLRATVVLALDDEKQQGRDEQRDEHQDDYSPPNDRMNDSSSPLLFSKDNRRYDHRENHDTPPQLFLPASHNRELKDAVKTSCGTDWEGVVSSWGTSIGKMGTPYIFLPTQRLDTIDKKVWDCNPEKSWEDCCDECANNLQEQKILSGGWNCEVGGGHGIWLQGCEAEVNPKSCVSS